MKVCLSVVTVTGDPPTADARPTAFEFIYGVGPAGITPFEKALFGKRVGERIQIDVPAGAFHDVMGHLAQPLCEQAGITAPSSIRATVADVCRATDRDVVKAMAAGGGCGDCGCGCGGHSQ